MSKLGRVGPVVPKRTGVSPSLITTLSRAPRRAVVVGLETRISYVTSLRISSGSVRSVSVTDRPVSARAALRISTHVRPAERFAFELYDPVLDRTIAHEYAVNVLPVVS